MKTSHHKLALVIAFTITLQSIPAQEQPKPAELPKPVGTGLILLRYPIQHSQMSSDNSGYIPYYDLLDLKPYKAPKVFNSISKWQKSIDENAILMGYIKIEKPGEYAFRTSSGYDRNELVINGDIVCKMCDGENTSQLVTLPKGIIPIVSTAYVRQTDEIRVQWIPPGQADWSDIPNSILSHPAIVIPK